MSLKDKLLNNPSVNFDGRLFHQRNVSLSAGFLDRYLEIREKEGRVYGDEVVAKLPLFLSGQGGSTEWSARAFSTKMLIKYLTSISKPHAVMELGCGNGWLSASLARVLDAEVCGIDINHVELNQAARVFSIPNLFFVNGDVMSIDLQGSFDTIVLAGSVQYFPDIKQLIDRLFSLLNAKGEIHILDSPIYKSGKEAGKARARSRKYFNSFGVSKMGLHYFHHSFENFNNFHVRIVSDPRSIMSLLKRKVLGQPGPVFPWVILTKD